MHKIPPSLHATFPMLIDVPQRQGQPSTMQKENNENVTLKTTLINLCDVSMRKVMTGINYKLHVR